MYVLLEHRVLSWGTSRRSATTPVDLKSYADRTTGSSCTWTQARGYSPAHLATAPRAKRANTRNILATSNCAYSHLPLFETEVASFRDRKRIGSERAPRSGTYIRRRGRRAAAEGGTAGDVKPRAKQGISWIYNIKEEFPSTAVDTN